MSTTKQSRSRKYRTEAERERARKQSAQAWYFRTKIYSERTIKRWTELDNLLKTGLKFCPGCEENKTPDEFYVRTVSIDGLSTYCRECQSERASENYRQNKKLRQAARENAHKQSL